MLAIACSDRIEAFLAGDSFRVPATNRGHQRVDRPINRGPSIVFISRAYFGKQRGGLDDIKAGIFSADGSL
jgi:hypothetical protein